MYTVRGTKKLLDRVGRPMADPPSSTTVLGDWYANVLFWRPHVALFVNATTFVPVLIPLARVSDSPTSPAFGTVGELCDKWWMYSSPNLSPAVAREYPRLIDRRLVPAFGHVKVADLRANQLDAWYSELLASGAVSGRPLSANSVRHIHSVLHRALEQGIAWDWIAYNPAHRASPPPARRPYLHLPSAEEVVGLIEAARSVNRSLPIFLRLAAVTGARRGELCALQWKHVDLHRCTLHIAGQVAYTATGPVQRPTKTHAERRLTLDPVTLAELGELAASQRTVESDRYIFSHDPKGLTPWRPGYTTLAFARRSARPCQRFDDAGHLRALHATG